MSSLIEECLMAGKSWQASIEPLCPLTAKGHRQWKKGRQGKVDWKKTVRFKHYGNQLLDWGMPHGCPILAGLQRGPLPRDIYSEKRGDREGGIGRKLPGLNIQDTFKIIRQKNTLFSGHAFLLTVLGIVAQSINLHISVLLHTEPCGDHWVLCAFPGSILFKCIK